MANPYSGQSLENNLLVYGLYKQNWQPSTYLVDQKYAVITTFTDKLSTPIWTNEVNGKYHWAQIGNLGVTATIGGRTTNPSNSNYLDLTWADPTFDDIRVTELWLSGIQTLGRVVAHVPGKATISPVGANSFATSDFAIGQTISYQFNASPSNGSGPIENRWYTPTSRVGYAGVTREDRSISRRELKVNTWVNSLGDRVWEYAQQPLMLQAANKNWEARILTSKAYDNGTYQTSIGLLDEIRNYGQHMPLMDTQNMETKLISMIETLAIKGGSKTDTYIVFTGTKGLGLLQTAVFKQYIIYTGIENNLKINGEEFVGINANCYAYSGITLKFVKHALLDDIQTFPYISTITGSPAFSNMMIFIDPTPIKTVDGEKSAFQKVCWGEPGDADMGSYIIPGLMAKGIGPSELGSIGRDYTLTSNAVDGASFGVFRDCGVYFPNVQAFGLMELAY